MSKKYINRKKQKDYDEIREGARSQKLGASFRGNAKDWNTDLH